MKKREKKLVLAKETVRVIERTNLEMAHGGSISVMLRCPSQGEGPYPIRGFACQG